MFQKKPVKANTTADGAFATPHRFTFKFQSSNQGTAKAMQKRNTFMKGKPDEF